MSYEQRDNSGSLFKNDRKEKENHPDYTGTAMIDGVDYYLNAWLKTSSKGTKFFSFSFKRKEPKPDTREADFRQAVEQNFGREQISDDLPF